MIFALVQSLTEPNHTAELSRAIKDPENRSIEIGIACTILFHVFLMLVAPRLPVELLHGSLIGSLGDATPKGSDFNIELAPEDIKAQRDPMKFVETNPDAPENEPNKTANFSNRNQQSAQPEAAKELDPENRPSLTGEKDIANDTAIVSGTKSQPDPGAPAVANLMPAPDARNQPQGAAQAEQVPLAGTDKVVGDNPDGVGTNISESKSPSNNADQSVDGAREATDKTVGAIAVNGEQRQQPRPRPRLSHSRPNVLQNRIAGTAQVGILGIDARWSEYGDYMQELIEIVDEQWHSILNERRTSPAPGTHVSVTFTLDSKGATKVVSVEETAGRPGVYACLSAIEDRQPYRPWSNQMIAVLGDEQTMTFTFYYR